MLAQTLTSRFLGAALAVAVALLSGTAFARAPGVSVTGGEVRLRDGVYYLSADLDVALSDPARRALNEGVALVMLVEVRVTRVRAWWLWNETVAEREHRYRLQYHALAERYMLTNLRTGDSRSFRGLAPMLAAFARIEDLAVIDRRLLADDQRYQVSLRSGIDLNALPRPLHTLAYISPGWRLMSDWHSWALVP